MINKKIIIFAAGKIGSTIFKFLSIFPELELTLVDQDEDSLTQVIQGFNSESLERLKIKTITPHCDYDTLFRQQDYHAVINAGPYFLSIPLAQAAFNQGLSYFDLTEDVASCEFIKVLSRQAKRGQVFVPQCGLAPGFISILARSLYDQFNELESVHLRVGALPQFPTNQMLYNLTWSTAGLVNEYCNLCQSIEQGQPVQQAALENKESFSLEGVEYEAFNTSGGLGTLNQTLLGKVEQLNYKTVRYPGHRDLMKFLLHDLKFKQEKQRAKLVELLDSSIPTTSQDRVLIMVTVTGYIQQDSASNRQYQQKTALRKITHREIELSAQNKTEYSAIQICTAASLCAVVELWMNNRLAEKGFIKQESIVLDELLHTHYGQYLQE